MVDCSQGREEAEGLVGSGSFWSGVHSIYFLRTTQVTIPSEVRTFEGISHRKGPHRRSLSAIIDRRIFSHTIFFFGGVVESCEHDSSPAARTSPIFRSPPLLSFLHHAHCIYSVVSLKDLAARTAKASAAP